jgi:patatin-like phospholipase
MNSGIPLLLAALLLAVLLYPFRTHWIYLCRVSLLGLLFLGLLPLLAFSLERPLLIGVFDLDTTVSGMAVGFLLFFVAWAIIATSQLVIRLADARLGVTVPRFGDQIYFARLILVLLAVAINFGIVMWATDGPKLEVFLGLFAGLAAGLAAFAVIQLWERKIRKQTTAPLRWICHQLLHPDVVPPTSATAPKGGFRLWGLIPVPAFIGRGYLQESKEGVATFLLDHRRAAQALGVFAAFYVGFFILGIPLPALCYLLLLLIIFIWLLSVLAFFFDAYRVPLLISLILLVCLSSWSKKSDHFYRIWPAQPLAEPDTNPGEVLARAADDGQPVVLIAAAGGGIQAAAWTARVLTGLEEILDQRKPGTFARSIRMLSGVSGGSAGIMFYVHATYPLGATGTAAVARHRSIVEAASASSLGQAVQGLAYSDLWRTLPPFFVPRVFEDRAEGLERAWIENADSKFGWANVASLKDATLNKWRHDLAERKRPAVIFNSTVVESGERFTFSTSRFRDEDLAQGQGDFAKSCKDTDISIVTAARLSATFPVVSPAARPELAKDSTSNEPVRDGREIPSLHLVDGGYFDNSGLVALSTWLDSALQYVVLKRPSKVPEKILVIQILPFPEPVSADKKAPASHFSQILSPLQTVLSVREQIQTGMTQRDFAFVTKRWKLEAFSPDSPAKIRPIDIQLVNVVYRSDGQRRYTPLSWHLRKSEQAAIEESWKRFKNHPSPDPRDQGRLDAIERFFSDY